MVVVSDLFIWAVLTRVFLFYTFLRPFQISNPERYAYTHIKCTERREMYSSPVVGKRRP
uniref:Uncharacterized protein n=1 Tax=Helianthus annuus TaxID=4232 RepID=A0A251RZN3_HELAN